MIADRTAKRSSKLAQDLLQDGDDLMLTNSFVAVEDHSSTCGNLSDSGSFEWSGRRRSRWEGAAFVSKQKLIDDDKQTASHDDGITSVGSTMSLDVDRMADLEAEDYIYDDCASSQDENDAQSFIRRLQTIKRQHRQALDATEEHLRMSAVPMSTSIEHSESRSDDSTREQTQETPRQQHPQRQRLRTFLPIASKLQAKLQRTFQARRRKSIPSNLKQQQQRSSDDVATKPTVTETTRTVTSSTSHVHATANTNADASAGSQPQHDTNTTRKVRLGSTRNEQKLHCTTSNIDQSDPRSTFHGSLSPSNQSLRSNRLDVVTGRSLLQRQKAQVFSRPSCAHAEWDVASPKDAGVSSNWSQVSRLTGDDVVAPVQMPITDIIGPPRNATQDLLQDHARHLKTVLQDTNTMSIVQPEDELQLETVHSEVTDDSGADATDFLLNATTKGPASLHYMAIDNTTQDCLNACGSLMAIEPEESWTDLLSEDMLHAVHEKAIVPTELLLLNNKSASSRTLGSEVDDAAPRQRIYSDSWVPSDPPASKPLPWNTWLSTFAGGALRRGRSTSWHENDGDMMPGPRMVPRARTSSDSELTFQAAAERERRLPTSLSEELNFQFSSSEDDEDDDTDADVPSRLEERGVANNNLDSNGDNDNDPGDDDDDDDESTTLDNSLVVPQPRRKRRYMAPDSCPSQSWSFTIPEHGNESVVTASVDGDDQLNELLSALEQASLLTSSKRRRKQQRRKSREVTIHGEPSQAVANNGKHDFSLPQLVRPEPRSRKCLQDRSTLPTEDDSISRDSSATDLVSNVVLSSNHHDHDHDGSGSGEPTPMTTANDPPHSQLHTSSDNTASKVLPQQRRIGEAENEDKNEDKHDAKDWKPSDDEKDMKVWPPGKARSLSVDTGHQRMTDENDEDKCGTGDSASDALKADDEMGQEIRLLSPSKMMADVESVAGGDLMDDDDATIVSTHLPSTVAAAAAAATHSSQNTLQQTQQVQATMANTGQERSEVYNYYWSNAGDDGDEGTEVVEFVRHDRLSSRGDQYEQLLEGDAEHAVNDSFDDDDPFDGLEDDVHDLFRATETTGTRKQQNTYPHGDFENDHDEECRQEVDDGGRTEREDDRDIGLQEWRDDIEAMSSLL